MADMIKDGTPNEVRENMIKASVERFTRAPVLAVACLSMKDMIRYADESRQKCEHDLAVQSLGAAIQNMLLKAYSLGLGSLWICDVYSATKAITKHFNKTWKLAAAVTLGWPAQTPEPRPRKPIEEVSDHPQPARPETGQSEAGEEERTRGRQP